MVDVGSYLAKVDDEDLDLVSAYRWYPRPGRGVVYAQAAIRRPDGKWTTIFMHRMILAAPPLIGVDHRNHDGLDNRRANLRLATQTQNLGNSRIRSDNTSGHKGVYWDRWNGKWRAEIKANGKRFHLGRFVDLDDAANAYDRAAAEHFGPFALTNGDLA
jgi:hypothetical protein